MSSNKARDLPTLPPLVPADQMDYLDVHCPVCEQKMVVGAIETVVQAHATTVLYWDGKLYCDRCGVAYEPDRNSWSFLRR